MSLVPAKCTQCGANLQVDLSQDASICPYCNTAYITEKAVNNYNTTNITNIDRLHADTVNISTQRVIEDKVTAGNTFVDLEEYEQAEKLFVELIDKYPQEYRGWVGMIKVNTKNCQEKVISKGELKKLQFWYGRALKVVSEDNKPDLEASCGEYIREVEAQLNTRVNTAKAKIDELNTQYSMITDIFTQATKPIKYFNNFEFWFTWVLRVILAIAVLGIVVFLFFDTYDQMDASLFFVPALGTILAAVVIYVIGRVIMRYCGRGLARGALSQIKAQSVELHEMCVSFIDNDSCFRLLKSVSSVYELYERCVFFIYNYSCFQLLKAVSFVEEKFENELRYNEFLFKNGFEPEKDDGVVVSVVLPWNSHARWTIMDIIGYDSKLRDAAYRCTPHTYRNHVGEVKAVEIRKKLEKIGVVARFEYSFRPRHTSFIIHI